jgi:hypothetical protein
MKAILQDIIAHTYNLRFLNLVKITGTQNETRIDSMSDDRKVVMFAKTKMPYPDMQGVFGMPQLNKLKYNLDCPEYSENATIQIISDTRNGAVVPVGIHFENQTGDFKNDYRFMNAEIINDRLKSVKFNSVKWDLQLEPTMQAIQRFQLQAVANSEHSVFATKTVGSNLKFIFGDASTHGGEFVFAPGISGSLKRSWSWPVANVVAILKLAEVNSCKISISDAGALMIILDSGLAEYQYIIRAES